MYKGEQNGLNTSHTVRRISCGRQMHGIHGSGSINTEFVNQPDTQKNSWRRKKRLLVRPIGDHNVNP